MVRGGEDAADKYTTRCFASYFAMLRDDPEALSQAVYSGEWIAKCKRCQVRQLCQNLNKVIT